MKQNNQERKENLEKNQLKIKADQKYHNELVNELAQTYI